VNLLYDVVRSDCLECISSVNIYIKYKRLFTIQTIIMNLNFELLNDKFILNSGRNLIYTNISVDDNNLQYFDNIMSINFNVKCN